jgi:hypothetical protein
MPIYKHILGLLLYNLLLLYALSYPPVLLPTCPLYLPTPYPTRLPISSTDPPTLALCHLHSHLHFHEHFEGRTSSIWLGGISSDDPETVTPDTELM